MSAPTARKCPACMTLGCEVPPGGCRCGCGQPAPIAKKTATKYGHIKGEPVRYINGHHQRSTRLSSVDYVIDEVTGCWIWQPSLTVGGYGHLRESGQMQYAHRVYDERFRGMIPAGLQLDHLCRNRRCVNPAHLAPVACQENILRGDTIAASAGLMIDHLCRNRACVNPYHLEPVTARENAARRDRAKKRAVRVPR